jgi:hypothetical protein
MLRVSLAVHLFLRDRNCFWSQLKISPGLPKGKVLKLLKTIYGLIQVPLFFLSVVLQGLHKTDTLIWNL